MKITKRQLKKIINESVEDNLYVVIANAGQGRQSMWPKSERPGVYSKAEAEAIVKEQNSGSRSMGFGGSIHYHAQPLSRDLLGGRYGVAPGNEAYIGLTNLLADYEDDSIYREVSDTGRVDAQLYSSDHTEESEIVNEQYVAMAYPKPSVMKSRASEYILRIMGKTKKMDEQKIEENINHIVDFLLQEGTLYVSRGYMGTPMIEDENEEPIGAGEMIRALVDAGDDDIFDFPQGVSKGALQKLLKQDKENQQGSIENWDNDVFSNYYNVDLDRVIRLYARLKNLTIKEVSEEDEYEDDGTNDFEEYYS
jgi:hypothetical protein